MNFHTVVPLVAFLCNIALIFLVLRKGWARFLHRIFSLFLLVLALWALGIFGMRLSPDLAHALVWEKAVIIVGPSASVLFLHFTMLLTRVKRTKGLLPTAYAVIIAFVPLSIGGFVVSGMQLKPYGYAPILGPAFYPWILCIYLFLLIGAYNLIKSRKYLSVEGRNRSAYIIAGVAIYIVAGGTDVLPVMGIRMYPLGMIGNIIFCILTSVAILRHHLLDIHIAFRKGTAYFLMSALFAIPYLGIIVLFTQIFKTQPIPIWVYVALLIILALTLQPSWSWVQRQVDKWFYRERYDYLKALDDFTRQTQSLGESGKLGSNMVDLIAGALHASSVYLLQPRLLRGELEVVASTGTSSPADNIALNSTSPLVNWLKSLKGVLSYEDTDIIPQLQDVSSKEKAVLEQLGAELIVPLKTRTGELSGLLVLGPKLSEQPYTIEDRQLVYTLGSQMGTNLENVLLYDASQQEVVERRQAEHALRESERKFRRLVATAPDGIVLTDAQGTILDVNETYTRMFGYKRDEVLGKSYLDFLPSPHIRAKAEQMFRSLRETGRIPVQEITIVTRGGKQVQSEQTMAVLRNGSGRITHFIAIIRDITERKLAEERKRKVETLKKLERLRTQLLANVSHELRTPLATIKGYSTMLLDYDTRLGREEKRRCLESIDKATDRQVELIDGLLAMSRIEAGLTAMEKAPTSISKLIREAVAESQIRAPRHKMVMNLPKRLPRMNIDARRIRQVLDNLIDNAAKYSREGTEIVISAQPVRLGLQVSVSDQGVGIPAQELPRVFSRLYRSQRRLIPGTGGAGLGLSISKALVEAHRGRIWVKSEKGKGSTFYFTLPHEKHDEKA